MRETFSLISCGSWYLPPERAFLMRHQAQPAKAARDATPSPSRMAFQVSPPCIQKYALSAGRASNARIVMVAALVRSIRAWAVAGDVLGSYAGLGLVFSMCWVDQSGPRDASLIRLTTRSPSSRSDREPMTDIRWVGALVQQVVVPEGAQGQVLRPPEPQVHGPRLLSLPQPKGSSSAETSFTLAWG